MEPDEIFVTGYAKLPKGITAAEFYKVIAVGLIIDRQTGTILDGDCSLVTRVAKEFFRELVVGKNIDNYEEIHSLFMKKYYGSAKKALISALKICSEKYKQILENSSGEDNN